MLLRGCLLLLMICGLQLQGCGGSTYIPVSDRSQATAPQPAPASYVVQEGDTLYAIAFRYGMDFRELARLNRISGSYQIYPGQRLKLRTERRIRDDGRSIVRDASVSQRQAEVSRQPVVSSTSVRKSSKTPVEKASSVSSQAPPAPVANSGPIKWQWPSSGEVFQNFSTKGKVNKGINIAGSKGDPVYASAAGRVVYAGNGLLGYGNLVIIDHNQQFLSAYAHNSRVLVKENDMVKTGQKIAEFGNSGSDRVMLHFEIRRDGQPLNPLRFLPKR